MYQTTIMVTALIYVMLGLGLNIVVGLAGLLDLGYVAFYAVGAYAYALLNYHFGLSFWMALPIGGALGATFGIILVSPCSGFAEIILPSLRWDSAKSYVLFWRTGMNFLSDPVA